MNIITKYLYKEFFRFTAICLLLFSSLYLIIHFFGRVDEFSEAKLPLEVVLSYFLYRLPSIVAQVLPVSVLISTIVLFSLMKKHNEIIALKASGVDLLQLARPMLLVAILVSIGLFLFSETVVPYASSKSYEIWRVKVRHKDPGRYFGRYQIWYKGHNAIYWIKKFDSKRGVMKNPSFYFFDDSFRLKRRIDAKAAHWKGANWRLRDGVILEISGQSYTPKRFETMDLVIPETPEDFMQEELKPQELSYWQLKKFAKRIKAEGYDPTRYLVDLHIKVAFPFIVFVMVLVGIPLCLKLQRGGTAVSVSAGIGLCFVYLLFLGSFRALGFAGIFPPLMAAWLANALFFFGGVYFLLTIPR